MYLVQITRTSVDEEELTVVTRAATSNAKLGNNAGYSDLELATGHVSRSERTRWTLTLSEALVSSKSQHPAQIQGLERERRCSLHLLIPIEKIWRSEGCLSRPFEFDLVAFW